MKKTGTVQDVIGLLVKASIPDVRIGELCELGSYPGKIPAEVIGFRTQSALLMPLGPVTGLKPGTRVESHGRSLQVYCHRDLLGRVLDGLGHPIDGGIALRTTMPRDVDVEPMSPMDRQRIDTPICTGIRAVDGLLTMGCGQRIGVFAAAGTGKSTLLGQIAKSGSADVNVVALIGERGREVREFLEDSLGESGLERSVVVVSTSDQPSLIRLKSAYVATAIAEFFRDFGARVMLMMDSVTRFARALREIGLAIGEPPARGGYTPSVFSTLPRLLERPGNNSNGSISAIYTVLVAGDDLTEPVADEVMSILDGHVILSRHLAARAHYPAIDILTSKSRVMNQIISRSHLSAAKKFVALYAEYEQNRDAIQYGFYRSGSNPTLDRIIANKHLFDSFLVQDGSSGLTIQETADQLSKITETFYE